MSATFTPGPWSVFVETEQSGIYRGTKSVFIADGRGRPDGQIARAYIMDGLDEREANAHLIAAAPELLDSCAQMRAAADVLIAAVLSGDTRAQLIAANNLNTLLPAAGKAIALATTAAEGVA